MGFFDFLKREKSEEELDFEDSVTFVLKKI